MKRWSGPLILGAILALGAHYTVLQGAPGFVMDKALERLEERGVPLQGFLASPRITPQTQSVVRASPDLAYSVCRYDFSADRRAMIVRAAPWEGYASLSFFDDRTDNYATLRGSGEGIETLLLPPGGSAGAGAIASPSERGVILIRRLAPDAASHARALAVSDGDRCAFADAENIDGR